MGKPFAIILKPEGGAAIKQKFFLVPKQIFPSCLIIFSPCADNFYYKLSNKRYKLCNMCYKVSNMRYKVCNKNFLQDSKKYLLENKKYLRANKKYQADSFYLFTEHPAPLQFVISNLDSFAWYSYCKGIWKALRDFVLPSRQLMP